MALSQERLTGNPIIFIPMSRDRLEIRKKEIQVSNDKPFTLDLSPRITLVVFASANRNMLKLQILQKIPGSDEFYSEPLEEITGTQVDTKGTIDYDWRVSKYTQDHYIFSHADFTNE